MCKRQSIWLHWRENRNVISRDITGGTFSGLYSVHFIWDLLFMVILVYCLVDSRSGKETHNKDVMREI